MEQLAKGNIRRMLQDYVYGEIEEYLADHRGVRCPDTWRFDIRNITRLALDTLFNSDESVVENVEDSYGRLCFDYVLRRYGVGNAARVAFERDGDDYLRISFSLLRDGHVHSSVIYERDYDDASMVYQVNGVTYSVMG